MKLPLIALAFAIFGTTIASAPIQPKENPEATRINLKVRRLQILNQLLPVLMTSDQIKKLLPVIESARQKEVDLQAEELKALKKLEPKIDAELKNAIEKKMLPSDAFIAEYVKTTNAMALGRQILVGGSTNSVLEKMKEVLNEGQLKAAANALDPELLGENPETMDQDAKLRLWIKEVLLDRASYDVLVDMSKH